MRCELYCLILISFSMKTEVINGFVIYCFVTAKSAEINFLCNNEPKGFIVTAENEGVVEQVIEILLFVKKGDPVTLTLRDRQITELFLNRLGERISAKDYPTVGLAMKESAYKKILTQFVRGNLHSMNNKASLQFTVKNAKSETDEKSAYYMEADKKHALKMRDFLQNCQPGDILLLDQNPEGEITHIVNQTKAVELAV